MPASSVADNNISLSDQLRNSTRKLHREMKKGVNLLYHEQWTLLEKDLVQDLAQLLQPNYPDKSLKEIAGMIRDRISGHVEVAS